MLKLTVLSVVLLCLCAGCASTAPSANQFPAQNSALPSSSPSAQAPQSLPVITGTPVPDSTPISSTTVSSQSPTMLVGSGTPAVNGWQTFTWTALHLAIDYPPKWSVAILSGGLTFNSPQGQTIKIARFDTPGISPDDFLTENDLPNTRCLPGKNDYGARVRTCLDTISRSITANVVLNRANGDAALLVLTANLLGDSQTFDAMVGSVRAVP